ncbi:MULTISPECIES: riboflavin synthase [Haloferax]|uniref:Riboflavin synthase n=1 Tax=Haloferax massiliensis TaxID=1476858 RepID=A0A0D6JT95_9EURY|nr:MULTISPECIES: riboflavin synthase [Haloferax]MDS0241914.1 riboflavin synthase [Haloferax sp. S2CR25]MDS0445035.1 riboflavin synthase [Haloferax sp. S2CR25-2]CQR51185.1 Riboflavin synthase [Haloferax massiliensis]
MFTGIVEGPGEIVDVTDADGGRRLRIRTDLAFDDLHHGQSIAVSGVCLTVEAFGDDWFEVFLAAETVEKTYLGDVVEGDRVNLERALAADDRFDGHIVQGHVDGTTTVTNVERVGDDWFFEFDLPESLAKYVVQKGSVCLDGISLTVADRRGDSFAVAIIPTTYDLTTLSEKEVGDPIHVEVDVVAKYVESMLDGYAERLVAE